MGGWSEKLAKRVRVAGRGRGREGLRLRDWGSHWNGPSLLPKQRGQETTTREVGGTVHGCIDYVLLGRGAAVERVEPLLTEAEATRHTALPDPEHPSDHLPLVADLLLVS